MKQMLLALLASKKAIMTVLGAALYLVAQRCAWLDPAQASELLYPFVAYIVGQGIADHGKESRKVTVADGFQRVGDGAV